MEAIREKIKLSHESRSSYRRQLADQIYKEAVNDTVNGNEFVRWSFNFRRGTSFFSNGEMHTFDTHTFDTPEDLKFFKEYIESKSEGMIECAVKDNKIPLRCTLKESL